MKSWRGNKGDGGDEEAGRDDPKGNAGEQCVAQASVVLQQRFFHMRAARTSWYIEQGSCAGDFVADAWQKLVLLPVGISQNLVAAAVHFVLCNDLVGKNLCCWYLNLV
jgi:hypothetical protein